MCDLESLGCKLIAVELHNEEDKLFFTITFLTYPFIQHGGEPGIQFF